VTIVVWYFANIYSINVLPYFLVFVLICLQKALVEAI
jgi:hypothetical protein